MVKAFIIPLFRYLVKYEYGSMSFHDFNNLVSHFMYYLRLPNIIETYLDSFGHGHVS